MNREKLKSEMEKRGLNGEKLAELSKISPATISRILSGERGCTIDVARKIAKAMKLSNKTAYEIFFGQ